MSDSAASRAPGGRVEESSTAKTINLKVLGVCAVLLLAAMMYNSVGGGAKFAKHGGRSATVHEAALPLQKRPRKSKYDHGVDPDLPDLVVVGTPGKTDAKGKGAGVLGAAGIPGGPTTTAALPGAAGPVSVPGQASLSGQSFPESVDVAAGELTKAISGYSCHAREGFDIAGDAAYVWGLSFNVESASECCAACAAQRLICGEAQSRGKPFWRASRRERTQGRCSGAPGLCNAWVFCPGSSDTPGAEDRCFSYTIHNHTKGECWLKHEANESAPIAAGPRLPLSMRRAARRDWPWAVAENVWPWGVPEKIAWQSGIIAKKDAPVWRSTRLPDWHHKFCSKHGC